MSGDILDVAKLEKDYPFLDKVWDTYKEFDNPVDGDQYKPRYEAFCNPLMQQLHNSKEEHKNFCLKLLRNFGHYSENSKFLKFSSKDCNYLNNWVYNSIKKYSIPDKIITECFDDFKSNMQGIGKKDMCLYFPYEDNYKEAMNIIILDIFQSNIDIVIDIVGRENSQTDFRMQNYICECVNIYKEMNKKYCSNTYDEDQKKKLTCISLNTFKGTYDSFLFSTQHKKYKIPSLYNVEEDYLNMCEKKAPKLALTSQMSETSSVLQDETQYGERKSGDSPHLSSMNDGNQGSSMSRTVSTAFGTVAGASSILALLYKFSPGRNWIRSGFRGGTGRINSNLYADQPNEVFYDGFEGEVMSSYNPTYNVGYGSV